MTQRSFVSNVAMRCYCTKNCTLVLAALVDQTPRAEYRRLPPGGRQPTHFAQVDNLLTNCRKT